MTWPQTIQRALALPGGATFYRCALQVNPHDYLKKFRGAKQGMDSVAYVQSIIDKCVALSVQAIAVTDHNDVSQVDLFREIGAKNGVRVFPGFELSSSESVHVLCIYPPETRMETLERFLGAFGIHNVGSSSDLSPMPLVRILEYVREKGGVTIAAHVTNEHGLLKTLPAGLARVNAWKHRELVAVQLPGVIDDAPDEFRPILRNQNPDYRREPGAGKKLAVAVVNAKDVGKPEDLDDPSASCWIKMSEVSVDGLRQAFLDPDSRVRLSKEPLPSPHAEFISIAWQGGFLGGCSLHFNPNLNVLVGGRGSGKSTVVESLRCVLGLQPLGDEARKAHEGIVRQVLQSGTQISLLIRSHKPSPREFLIERTIPNPPLVKDESGSVLSAVTPLDLIPGIEIYGQHEISELAKSKEKLTRLLQRFVDEDPALKSRKLELRRELDRSRAHFVELRKEMQHVAEQVAVLPGLEETLKRFQDAGLEEKLREQTLLVREERVLKTASERVSPPRQAVEALRRNLPIDRAFLAPKALEDLPGRDTLRAADAVLQRLNDDLGAAALQASEAVDRAVRGIEEVRLRWQVRKAEVHAAYEKILRELQKSKIDGEEFLRLRRQIEDIRPLREREAVLRREEKEVENRRLNLLAEWEQLKAGEFRELAAAAKDVSKQLIGRVRVQVTFAGNRDPLLELLREIPGRLADALEVLKNKDNLSLAELVEAIRSGSPALRQKYMFSQAQSERIASADADLVMRVEELDLSPTTEIELNVAAEGQPEAWQKLDDLSTGQKATAVLLLLLLESDAPLVVDQPEDDLDNRFISDGIVPKMREEKRRRQFVFATHNANIPVLGDAELIAGLSAAGEAGQGHAKIPPEHVGSIDSRAVRELVEELLEGGKEAFEMRRLKYGF